MKKMVSLLTFLFFLSGTSLVFAESTEKIDLNTKEGESVTSLNNLIQETITKNPMLLSLGYQITAQGAKTKWIKVRPDPYISNSTNTHQYPFNYGSLGEDPMNQVQFVLGQDFPFPGKLKLKGKVETAELGRIKKDYDLTRLELTSRLKKSYYDLYLTTKSLRVIEDVKILLETLAGTVKAKYEVGDGNQQELLKVHLEISKLLQQLETLKKNRETFIAEINSITIRPQGTNIDEIEDIKKQELSFNIDELLSESKNKYPLLLGQKALIEKNDYGVKLAKKEYYPDYSVEGGYGLRSKPMDPMYMFQVMTSLPVYFRSKQRNQVKEANASLQAANENYNATLVETEKKVKELVIEIEKNNTLINLLETGIIPQARLTLDASIAAYKVNKTDFLNVLDNIRALLEFQINYYERLTDYEKAIAELEPLIGREI
jgi:outer membrane protein TolC